MAPAAIAVVMATIFVWGVFSARLDRADLSAPDVKLTIPTTDGEYRNQLVTISGTASDGAGISEIHIEVSSPSVSPTKVWNRI